MGLLSPFPPFFLLLLYLIGSIHAETIVLLNTSSTKHELKWPVFPSLEETFGVGWAEETYPIDHINKRMYVSCLMAEPQSDSWLFAPRVERSNTSGSNRIRLRVEYSLRECGASKSEGEDVGDDRPLGCKETFEVYYRRHKRGEKGGRFINTQYFNRSDWKLTRRWSTRNEMTPSDGARMAVSVDEEMFIWDHDDDAIYFAFRDDGACVSLINIEISYDVCSSEVIDLAEFPLTPIAVNQHDYVPVEGICIENATMEMNSMRGPMANCKGDGSWQKSTEKGCQCKEGYYHIGNQCLRCGMGQISTRGSRVCSLCPRHTVANPSGSRCDCEDGFYRLDQSNISECFGIPSKPRKIQATEITQTSVVLSWQTPARDGGLTNLYYNVECSSCTEEEKSIISQPLSGSKSIRLNGLEPQTNYTFRVYSRNGVSDKSDRSPEWSSIDVNTSPYKDHTVINLRKLSLIGDNGISIGWDAPSSIPKQKDEPQYEVEMRNANGKVEKHLTKKLEFTFGNLNKGEKYIFRVRANINGWGQWYRDPLSVIAGDSDMRSHHATSTRNGETSGSYDSPVEAMKDIPTWALILLVLLLLTLILFFIIAFRRKSNQNRKQMSDLDVLDTYKQDTMTPDYNSAHRPPFDPLNECFKTNKLNAPLIPPYGDHTPKSSSSHSYGMAANHNRFKPYVDPMAYEDPNQALTEFAFDIPPEAVRVTGVIGGGEFGDVCKAQLNTAMLRRTNVGAALIAGGFEREIEAVACKTLKPGSASKAKADFLLEASIMGQFAHPNVVRLIGVVTKAEPVMIVAEYMSHGSLDQFLRTRDARGDEIGMNIMLSMLSGIAAGMKYLTEKGFVHRDLAARNVLVDENLTCKIADFGLSRGVDKLADQEYTTNGGKIPVRWTAPEAITHRKFTAASDVWSFGVVMWEVSSFGERPYWEWTNQKVISEIMSGYRLPAPMETPAALHRLMCWCWQIERHERPTFAQLHSVLERYSSQPELVYASENSGGSVSGSGDGRVRSMANLSNPYGSVAVAPQGYYHDQRIPAPPTGAPPSAPPLDEFLRSLGLSHCYDRLSISGVTKCDHLARMNHLEMLACGLISEEYQRIRDALAHLRIPSSSSVSSDRPPPPPTRRGYADTVATMPSRQGVNRSRGDDGFFV